MKWKSIALAVMLVLLVSMFLSMAATAQEPSATRDLPEQVNTGETFTVNIDIALLQFGQVEEHLPPDFTYVSVAPSAGMEGVSASEDDGVVTFTFLASTGAGGSFSYQVTAPSYAVTGAEFSGNLLGPDEAAGYPIGGDQDITVRAPAGAPTPSPTPTVTPTVTPTPTPSPTPGLLSGEGTVTAAGGTVSTDDGRVNLNFPAGAVTSDTDVSIAPSTAPGPAPGGFRLGSTTFSIEATCGSCGGTPVTELGGPIQVCVQYSSADIAAAGGNPELLTMAYYDATAGDWVALDTDVNTVTGLACAWTSHVSVWSILAESEDGGLVWWVWVVIGVAGLGLIVAIIAIARRAGA